jgi:hypothetical protein
MLKLKMISEEGVEFNLKFSLREEIGVELMIVV